MPKTRKRDQKTGCVIAWKTFAIVWSLVGKDRTVSVTLFLTKFFIANLGTVRFFIMMFCFMPDHVYIMFA